MDEKSDESCRMTAHPNVYHRALTILKRKGFKLLLWPCPTQENPANCTFWAKKGERNFDAQDPLRLLGLISIWEVCGDDWYHNSKIKTEKILDLLKNRAYPDSTEDFEKLTDEEFKMLVGDYQEFFELLFPNTKIEDNITREELYTIVTTFYKDDYEGD